MFTRPGIFAIVPDDWWLDSGRRAMDDFDDDDLDEDEEIDEVCPAPDPSGTSRCAHGQIFFGKIHVTYM